MNVFVGLDYIVGIVIIYFILDILVLVCCFVILLYIEFIKNLSDLENIF